MSHTEGATDYIGNHGYLRRGLIGFLLLVLAGIMAHYALLGLKAAPVKANEVQRFEPISQSEWTMHYQFAVFHDKVSGAEFICAVNDIHYNPTCFPSGRNWK